MPKMRKKHMSPVSAFRRSVANSIEDQVHQTQQRIRKCDIQTLVAMVRRGTNITDEQAKDTVDEMWARYRTGV